MQVHRIYTFSDLRNYTYLIEDGSGGAWCVDPFDAMQVIPYLKEHSLSLNGIINTHEHWDHTCGNQGLLDFSNCPVYGPVGAQIKIRELTEELDEGSQFNAQNGYIEVLDIPGHTLFHLGLLLYKVNDKNSFTPFAFMSGDTLFNGGVGRCDNGGDPELLYKTIIEKVSKLDDNILLYPGHDYYSNNLHFTLSIEADNHDAKELLESFENGSQDTTKLVTDFGVERKINTFFRLKMDSVREGLGLKDHKNYSDKEVFLELRRRRDKW